MRRLLVAVGLVALALPMAAPHSADAASCSSRKRTGTVVGAAGGALVGNAVSHGAGGLILGGLGGAVVGHEIGKSGCTYRRAARAPAPARAPATSASNYAPATHPARRVYYDQYGNPVSAAPITVGER